MHGARHDWLSHVRDRIRDGRLDSRAGHIAYVLAVDYVNGGNEAWPSQPELANNTGLTTRTVRRAVHDLEQQHLLTVRRGPPAGTSGNVYTLTTPTE